MLIFDYSTSNCNNNSNYHTESHKTKCYRLQNYC